MVSDRELGSLPRHPPLPAPGDLSTVLPGVGPKAHGRQSRYLRLRAALMHDPAESFAQCSAGVSQVQHLGCGEFTSQDSF